MKAPNQNPDCKECGKPFKRYNTIQNICVECSIKIGKDNPTKIAKKVLKQAENSEDLLIKGTAAFKKVKLEITIGERRNDLQKKINLLSRMIDAKFGYNTCIDCGKPFGKQVDAAHYHDMSTNRGIRFHLHNLHSAKSDCNKYSSNHKKGYELGLEKRYGAEYLEYVENLKLNQSSKNLSAIEIKEKLTLVNKLIRTFDTFQFENSIDARNKLNKIIAIYE